jgi:hypothetical protein
MYPGLSDTNCQIAAFHYRELVDEGQRQQFISGAGPVSGGTRTVSRFVRQQLGAVLVCAGQRLQGGQVVSGQRLVPTPTGKMNAFA